MQHLAVSHYKSYHLRSSGENVCPMKSQCFIRRKCVSPINNKTNTIMLSKHSVFAFWPKFGTDFEFTAPYNIYSQLMLGLLSGV